ncbi:MAG TPA: toprim domain-containing protein [Bacillus sp. (in: firmicutes)]|nr:toprim domain-containing protein [Bacillus sp. (in: firmicutes)]
MGYEFSRKWVNDVKKGIERMQQGLLFHLERIPETTFNKANDKEKMDLLKLQFEKLMEVMNVNLNGNLLCPYHNDTNPSLKYYYDTKKFYCFSECFDDGRPSAKGGQAKRKIHKDAFDLVGDMYQLPTFKEQYNMLVTLFVENPENFYKSGPYKQSILKKPFGAARVPKSVKKVLGTEDSDVKAYLNNRGFNDNMIQLFHLKAIEEDGMKYASVPCDNGFEVRRNIHFQPKYGGDTNGKYINPKGQRVHLFNGKVLKEATADTPVICVESAFDAVIIQSFGVPAVATNSLSSINKLVEKCIEINNKNLLLILLFDFDEMGRKASDKAYNQLKDSVNVITITYESVVIDPIANFLRDFKDIGEAYQEDKLKTEQAIRSISKVRRGWLS